MTTSQSTCHAGWERLNDKQRMVAERIGLGLNVREIAYEFERSNKTIEYHRTKIYFALGVRSPVELAHWLLQRKLIPFLKL